MYKISLRGADCQGLRIERSLGRSLFALKIILLYLSIDYNDHDSIYGTLSPERPYHSLIIIENIDEKEDYVLSLKMTRPMPISQAMPSILLTH